MLGAYLGGIVDDRIGSKRALQIAIAMSAVLLCVLVSIRPDQLLFFVSIEPDLEIWRSPYFNTLPEIAYFITNQVFAVFFVTGLSSSRTLMAKLSPPEKITQFFGLYALSGTVTAFLAPLMVGLFTDLFDSQRAGFAALLILMVIGFAMLTRVRDPA